MGVLKLAVFVSQTEVLVESRTLSFGTNSFSDRGCANDDGFNCIPAVAYCKTPSRANWHYRSLAKKSPWAVHVTLCSDMGGGRIFVT